MEELCWSSLSPEKPMEPPPPPLVSLVASIVVKKELLYWSFERGEDHHNPLLMTTGEKGWGNVMVLFIFQKPT